MVVSPGFNKDVVETLRRIFWYYPAAAVTPTEIVEGLATGPHITSFSWPNKVLGREYRNNDKSLGRVSALGIRFEECLNGGISLLLLPQEFEEFGIMGLKNYGG